MPTPAGLRARREALSTQRSFGVARVSYDGKTGNGGVKLGHGSGGTVLLRSE